MKLLSVMIVLLSGLFILSASSCDGGSGNGDSAEAVAKKFVQSVRDNDFVGVKKYTSRETDPCMDFLAKRMEMLKKMNKEEDMKQSFDNLDFSKATATCKEEGNTAVCQLCEEEASKCKDIDLIKEGGNWVVHMPKETEAAK